MNLLELMISEDVEWLSDSKYAAQHRNANIVYYIGKPYLVDDSGWGPKCFGVGFHACDVLADNQETAIITREDYEAATSQQAHPHAEIMAEYAEVAKTNPKPWKEFQVFLGDAVWEEMKEEDTFLKFNAYRRKPRTININGYEIPEPMRVAPNADSYYWIIAFGDKSGAHKLRWRDDEVDRDYLRNGGAHLTKEAAELHAKALLSFTVKETK